MNEEIKPNYGHLNGMEPAFSQKSGRVRCVNPEGLAKRELFAAMAMQAWISGLALRHNEQGYSDEAAANEAGRLAGISADVLLAELAKPQEVAP